VNEGWQRPSGSKSGEKKTETSEVKRGKGGLKNGKKAKGEVGFARRDRESTVEN